MKFKFPDVGEGITEGVIVKWKVKQGDKVKADQPIADVETDKAIVEIPVPKSGVIKEIFHKKGETIKVGETLVELDTGEKTEKAEKKSKKKETKSKAKKGKYTSSVVGFLDDKEELLPDRIQKKSSKDVKHVRATPKIRKLAKQLGVDITKIKGTGHDGRITAEDLKKSKKTGKIEVVPLKGLRKSISKTLTQANTVEVPVTNFHECDFTKLWDIRKKEKTKAEKKGIKLTFLPYVIKAVLEGIKKYPVINSSIEHDEIIIKKFYNIGIAVATDDGLIVPNIKDADKKSLYDLAKEMTDLSDKARERTLKLDEMKNGTFTITNLGSIGVTHFTPMLNYPEAAILGLGRIEDKPVVEDGKVVIKKIMPMSLTYDHRSIDGAIASMFMLKVIEKIEKADF